MYYVVTGAAGFIGSRIVEALNRAGVTDIVAVDHLSRSAKAGNLPRLELAGFRHEGARPDPMELDGRYMMENNYRYSKTLPDWCQEAEIPLLYASSASVYGAGAEFREERACERPLNVYGYSKFLFDQLVRRTLPGKTAQIAGSVRR